MSDINEDWKLLKEQNKNKKRNNLKCSLDQLKGKGIIYRLLNANTLQFLVLEKIDFYPTTGYWKDREKNKSGRGVKKLVSYVKSCVDFSKELTK